MAYIIIEIQKSNNGTVAIVPPASYDVHSVVMLSDTGEWMKGETYYHGADS
jgi:hypothetical protein